jgi:Cu/Ag efflux protein CusF
MRQWTLRVVVLALALALTAGAVWAGEVVGKIQKVDQDQKMFVLEDGTQLWAPDGTLLDQLKEGTKIKAAYEEKDGKNWATSIEVVAD